MFFLRTTFIVYHKQPMQGDAYWALPEPRKCVQEEAAENSINSAPVEAFDITEVPEFVRVRGYPLNGIFDPCPCLLAGGCGAWRLLARRRPRHRHRRHFGP